MNHITINELYIRFDLQPENRIDILEDVASKCFNGYLFVDSSDGHCYLFDEDGNEDDIKKLKKIYASMFYSSNIESIIIPDSVESIRYWVFAYCKNLKSIVIPDSVESIGDCAFAHCENLKSIEIPNSTESLGDQTFYGCESLKSLVFKGKTIDQVKEMENYPFGIKDESIIRCI